MALWWAIVFAIFSQRLSWKHIGEITVIEDLFKITFYSLQNGLNYTAIDFCEQTKHIRGSQTTLTFSPRPLNSLLATLKNILESVEWTNRIQEIDHWTNRKRRGPQRNLVDVPPSNVISPICFHLKHEGNVYDDVSSAFWKFINHSYFCPNIWIISRDPVPLKKAVCREGFLFLPCNN
jgi:hypothetical protein